MAALLMSDVIEIPALGRRFKIGTLYDCRTDRVVSGLRIWGDSNIASNIEVQQHDTSEFELIHLDDVESKSTALGLNDRMKVSVMAGLVSLGGCSKYFNCRTSSLNQERVTLKYKCITKSEQLDMCSVIGNTLQHPDVLKSNIATHVVTGIMYGGQAFMVFDRQNPLGKSTSFTLSDLISGISETELDKQGSPVLTEELQKLSEELKIQYFGDFAPPTSPTTYSKAVSLCKALPGLYRKQGDKCIPVSIWLCPLQTIDSSASTVFTEVSADSSELIEQHLENFHHIEMESDNLMRSAACKQFEGLHNEIKQFKSMCSQYRLKFQKHLINVVPKVRRGDTDETELLDFLDKLNESAFGQQRTSVWLKKKQSEVKVLHQYAKVMDDIEFVPTAEDLEAAYSNPNNSQVFCFSVRRPKTDSFLKSMSAFLRNGEMVDSEDTGTKSKQTMITNARLFIDAYHAKKSDKTTKFIYVEELTDKKEPGGYIYLYKDAILIDTNYIPSPHVEKSLAMVDNKSVTETEDGKSKDLKKELSSPSKNKMSQNACKAVKNDTENSSNVSRKDDRYDHKNAGKDENDDSDDNNDDDGTTLPQIKDILKNMSVKVTHTPPYVYRLPIEKTHFDKVDRIRKCELGHQVNNAIPDKVIMVVGATGSGKTTLINGMVNYILGVEWNDEYRFKLIVESTAGEEQNQAKSQTCDITSYTLYHQEGFKVPYSVTIIDTPGFGDTAGIMRDKEITEQIRKFFTTRGDKGIDHLDAVGFVAQSSLPRLTVTQRYIFDSILALFGKDIEENIFMLLTFADGQEPPVLAGLQEAKLPFQRFFKFNNSALFAKSTTVNDDDAFDRMFWKMGVKSFELFLDNLDKVEAKTLVLTKDVLRERSELEVSVQGIQKDIQTGLNTLEQLQKEIRVLKNHQSDIDKNKDFKYTVWDEVIEVSPIKNGEYTTNCLVCKRTCHYPCAIKENGQKGRCCAMEKGKCKICTAQCPWDMHQNLPHKYDIKRVKKVKTAADLKARYEDAVGKKLSAQQLVDKVLDEFEAIQVKVVLLTNSVRKCLKRLQEIALKPSPLSTTAYIDILIKSEKAEGKPGWEERMDQLTNVRKAAACMQELADNGFDPFEQYMPKIEEAKKSKKTRSAAGNAWQTVANLFRKSQWLS